jgi:ArsR family transcriptional regulator, lead/cadmium/zinc/bismuth-responsive transcriptional repressor
MVMGNPTRIKIIEALRKAPLNVSEICEKTSEEQSKVSHNLAMLFNCHFVDMKREGKKKVYSLNKDTIVPLLNLVEKHVESHCDKCWKKD